MKKARMCSFILALMLMFSLCGSVSAAQVDCDSAYCFSASDFSEEEATVQGICVLDLPDPATGTVMLGSRVIREGDILTAGQVEQMTFHPLRTEEDAQAVMTFLPIYEDRVATNAEMTISIRGKKDEAPAAEDFALETYKNLPNEGRLKACDPEGQELTYTVTRQPRRGTLELSKDGTFVYTPKKNKVGVDSFTFTATDPAGNVSREATVTVNILKPTAAAQYTDTLGESCRFEAEWLRNTGLFTGENLGGTDCFYPENSVSRGQFLAMVTQLLELPMEQSVSAQIPADVPQWLKPYYTAALRAGLTAGLPEEDQTTFRPYEAITGETAAVLLQNALQLETLVETAAVDYKTEAPTFAQSALAALNQNGISLPEDALTRADVAQLLYQVHRIAPQAPGLAAYRN